MSYYCLHIEQGKNFHFQEKVYKKFPIHLCVAALVNSRQSSSINRTALSRTELKTLFGFCNSNRQHHSSYHQIAADSADINPVDYSICGIAQMPNNVFIIIIIIILFVKNQRCSNAN